MGEVGFDIIGDINLQQGERFSWENKATSPYCILTGNISSDLNTIIEIVVHMSKRYQGVFFVPGILEYETMEDIDTRTRELLVISDCVPNVCMLHHNVVIIDGVAILGANGWNHAGEYIPVMDTVDFQLAKEDDRYYLEKTLTKLQRHLDVKKIVMVTNTVPMHELYFGEVPDDEPDELVSLLSADTEKKVSHWVFGTYQKIVDTQCDNVRYVNGPYEKSESFWAKRLTVAF